MLLRRLISLFLATILLTQPMTILASEPANSSDVLLTVVPQLFSAVVPTQLPVYMSANGVITTAEDTIITNTSKGPIRIDNIELANVKADWKLSNFTDDFSTFKVGSKKLAMSFNGDKSLASGNILLGAINLAPIDGLASMQLNYDAKIPAQSVGLVDVVPANVVFTLKWHEVGSANIEENPPSIYEFVPADTKILTINFKGVTADDDSVMWSSSNEAVATVADHVSRGRSRPIDGTKQCMVTAVGSGKAIITGTLKDGTANSFEIIVSDRGITSLGITKAPDKVAYIEGEKFSFAGMIVTASYNNGTSVNISDYVIADGNNLVMGQDSVTINYNGKSTTQSISVVEKSLTSIAITNPPNKTAYIEANDFDATGMIVTAYYDSGTNDIVVPTLSRNTNLTTGQTTVDVSYGGQTVTQNIIVNSKTMTSIAITNPPNKTAYVEGNNFDATGMAVTAYYDNGTTEVVATTLSRNTNLTVGQTSVDVSFSGKTTTQSITVAAKNLSSIAITTPPTKTTYAHWDNFDRAGMIVTASYNNGTTEDVTNYTVPDGTNMIGGKTSVTINYNGGTTTQDILVNNIIVGTKHTEGNYEYSYEQGLNSSEWETVSGQDGWDVIVIDNAQIDYASPLTVIQGYPVTDMSYLFSNSYVSTLNLINWDTSNVTDMSWMFDNSQVTSLDLSGFDTSNVTDMSNMFFGSQATSFDLSSLNTSNVTNMREMFSGSQATNLDLSSFDTSNVTNMSLMFSDSNATSLDLSSFDTSKVTNMVGMFYQSQATSLDLSGFDISNVTNMGSMFTRSQATSIDLSNWNLPLINKSGGADVLSTLGIKSLPNLKTLSLKNWIAPNITNMSNMFYESPIINLDLSGFDTSKVTNMGNMFAKSQATNLDLSSFDTSKVTNMFGMFNGSQATNLSLSSFDTSRVTNMASMFNGSRATSLDVSSFNTSNVTDMWDMFRDSQATNLDLSNFDTSNVTDMYSMFYNSQATRLDLRSFDTSNATDMSSMFDSSQATSLDLSSFNTSNTTNMISMFYNSKATSLDLSSFDTSNVINMDWMFNSSPATILDLSSFNTSNVKSMNKMFYSSQVKTLKARTQADANRYKASTNFPVGVTVTVKA